MALVHAACLGRKKAPAVTADAKGGILFLYKKVPECAWAPRSAVAPEKATGIGDQKR